MSFIYRQSLIIVIIIFSLILTIIVTSKLTPQSIDLSDNLDSKCESREKCLEELKITKLGNIASSTQKSIDDVESISEYLRIPYKLFKFKVGIKNNGSFFGNKLENSKDFVGKILYPTLECLFSEKKYRIESFKTIDAHIDIKYNASEISSSIQSYEGCYVLLTLEDISKIEVPIDYTGIVYQTWQRRPSIEFSHTIRNYIIIFLACLFAVLSALTLIKLAIYWYKKGWNGLFST